jgi:protein-L-isoaspartate(D-aspartate) O-methyltransferase
VDRIADFRRVFAQVVAARGDCTNGAIQEAFARVPRHEFVGPPPWYFTEHGGAVDAVDPALLYQDVAMGLARERGIPTGTPSLHARCIDACGVTPGQRVIHVGAGAGYYTAILAELVGAQGRVTGFELDASLAASAATNLRAWPWATVENVSGAGALPAADLIYVSCGVEQLPGSWLDSLAAGGRLLFPLVPQGEAGGMLHVRHLGSSETFAAEFVCPALFVPCIGAQDEPSRERLRQAFFSRPRDAVHSLRRQSPDESAWYVGHGWWLSTRAAG